MSDVEQTLQEREKTHGDYTEQALETHLIKIALRKSKNWYGLSEVQMEAIEMIAVKLGRILTGNPNEPDHWLDIAGYATLVAKELQK